MKLSLSKENVEAINTLLSSATISYGYMYWDGKRDITYKGVASDLHFDSDSKKWVVNYKGSLMSFRDLLAQVNYGGRYRTQSKNLKDLSNMYAKCSKKDNGDEFAEYLNNLGQKTFKIENVKIYEDEIEWLKDHVTNITARFPSKYKRAFEKAFPGSEYTIYDKGWNYSFVMYFDTMEGIPESLLKVGNSLGNSLDYDKKRMCNTSYIWNLIKNNAGFDFGKRDI